MSNEHGSMKIPLQKLKFSRRLDFIPDYKWDINKKYAETLRNKYGISRAIKNSKTDIEKVVALCSWTYRQFKHDDVNVSSRPDALTILEEAKKGKGFRCVEHGIVLTAVLKVVGFKARALSLATKDVELREYGGGHVVTEVYLPNLRKWVMADSDCGVVPFLYKRPLSAVELREAIIEHPEKVEFRSANGQLKNKKRKEYLWFVLQYLFYFTFSSDQRLGFKSNRQKCIKLGPIGAKKPLLFQGTHANDNSTYTHSLSTFYHRP
jgi:transglutaminase-like putative cysteine protease